MSATDDVFGSRPLRPQHPDFWRLSEIVMGNDIAMDTAEDKETRWEQVTGAVIDIPSVSYMAIMRVIKAFGTPTDVEEMAMQSKMAALVIDAIVTGVMFQQQGGHREE